MINMDLPGIWIQLDEYLHFGLVHLCAQWLVGLTDPGLSRLALSPCPYSDFVNCFKSILLTIYFSPVRDPAGVMHCIQLHISTASLNMQSFLNFFALLQLDIFSKGLWKHTGHYSVGRVYYFSSFLIFPSLDLAYASLPQTPRSHVLFSPVRCNRSRQHFVPTVGFSY